MTHQDCYRRLTIALVSPPSLQTHQIQRSDEIWHVPFRLAFNNRTLSMRWSTFFFSRGLRQVRRYPSIHSLNHPSTPARMSSTYKLLSPQCETTLRIEYFQKLAQIEADFKAELDAYDKSFEVERSVCHSSVYEEEDKGACMQQLKDLESQVLSSRVETVGFFARTRFWMPTWVSWLIAAWLTRGDRSMWNARALSNSVPEESRLARRRKEEDIW